MEDRRVDPELDDQLARIATAIAYTGDIQTAAVREGMSPRMAQYYKRTRPEFAEALEVGLATYVDKLHTEMFRRGVKGWTSQIVTKTNGDLVETRQVDGKLLLALARKHDPGLRHKTEVTHKGSIGHLHVSELSLLTQKLSPEARASLRAVIEELPSNEERVALEAELDSEGVVDVEGRAEADLQNRRTPDSS